MLPGSRVVTLEEFEKQRDRFKDVTAICYWCVRVLLLCGAAALSKHVAGYRPPAWVTAVALLQAEGGSLIAICHNQCSPQLASLLIKWLHWSQLLIGCFSQQCCVHRQDMSRAIAAMLSVCCAAALWVTGPASLPPLSRIKASGPSTCKGALLHG